MKSIKVEIEGNCIEIQYKEELTKEILNSIFERITKSYFNNKK